MKLLSCDLCKQVKQIRYIWTKCKCGNIKAKYLPDGSHVQVKVVNKEKCRILGFPNRVRHGLLRQSTCWYFFWTDELILLEEKNVV